MLLPFRGFVGQGGELGRVGEFALAVDTRGRAGKPWPRLLPRVIVPVLSRRRTSTSPAASTARPDMAMTLAWIMRSIPAMPMDVSRPPMVVGIRQTSRATSDRYGHGQPPVPCRPHAVNGEGEKGGTVASRKMMVSPASRMSRAISLGVFWRSWRLRPWLSCLSRNVSPGFSGHASPRANPKALLSRRSRRCGPHRFPG